MVDILETHFDHRKGCVTRLDVRYTGFDSWKCVRIIDVL